MDNTCPNPFTGGPQLTDVCTPNSLVFFLSYLNTVVQSSPKIGSPCGRVKPQLNPSSSYDFVVIGGGAGGSAVAARLSEVPEWKVLLLEAGPDEPAGAEIPANIGVFIGTELDWNFKTSNESYACLKYNGTCTWPRGKSLGGTTIHHGMGYHRGNPKDYANWVDMGNDGWSYDDVLPFFMKSEDNQEIGRVSAKYHGTGGVMNIERFPWQPPLIQSFLEAAEETGYGTTDDIAGDVITGFTILQTMSKGGVRQSSAAAYLRPIRDRDNLDIVLNATATKIVTSDKKVQAVEYVINGKVQTATVNYEVVVCGGAVNSPQLLLLSGIGPASELKSMGVDVVLDLPGVGKNIHNHLSFALDFTVPEKHLTSYNFADVNQYLTDQTGPLSCSGMSQLSGMFASKYTTPDYPDVQFNFAGYQEACTFNRFLDIVYDGPDNPIRIGALNLHPKSRGEITLASNDPLDHPKIWTNDLSEPDDVEVLIEALHVILDIANSTALQAKGLTISMKPIAECSEHEFLSDDYFRCAMTYETRTENHQAGSCKMGPESDSMAVVDPELRVHGISGLRVADASIMPQVISGNPQATITMIGERAADFIKKTYNKDKVFDATPTTNKIVTNTITDYESTESA